MAAAPNQATEQRWVIASILRDGVNLAAFAGSPEHWTPLPADAVDVSANADAAPGESYAVAIRAPGADGPEKSRLKIVRSAWAPELYVPTLKALCARMKLSIPAPQGTGGAMPEAELFKDLSNPNTLVIETQNRRLSAWLQEHPWDAQAHEQAALLLGTLAMRENSGIFWNPLGLCNRAAAHLAFARMVRPEPSVIGEVAELLIGLIIDTKADCQGRIAALQTRAAALPELRPWIVAASLRNTRDYRLLANPKDATFLERIEQFRAMAEAISSEEAVKRLENRQPDTAPDWSRMVLQSGYGVGTGHQFALPSISLEIKDALEVFPDLRAAQAPAQFTAILNQPPGDEVQADSDRHARLHVIDLGTWAQFFQRHLLQAGNETYNFLKNKWGVPEDAQTFRVQAGPLLKPLTLYPLSLKLLGKEDGEALHAPAADLLRQHPEWVGDGAWTDVVTTVPGGHARGGDWRSVTSAWFSPRLPTGTVYGFGWRAEGSDLMAPPELPEIQKAYEIAPLKYDVAWVYLHATAPGHHPTVEQFEKVMGPPLEFYLPAMWGEAQIVQADPAKYGAIMERAAALEPGYYLGLGEYYLSHRLEPEAARAYQAAIDHGADPVGVSNQCQWLVSYYYDHGQQEKAMTIAKMVAEVYSSPGLETLAKLLEKMGRIKEAEEYFEKINERYNETTPLHAFYARQATAHPEYAQRMRAAESDIFPQGMQEITLAELKGRPAKGVFVNGESELSRQAGLKAGAIVVGIDGKRVLNMNQYTFVRALTDSPEMTLLVYQSGKYQEIHANVPGRMFNVVFTNWPK